MAPEKAIRVYSHPRSGTHLMMHTLGRNFYPDWDLSTPGGLAGHWADRQEIGLNPVGQLFGGHGRWNKRIRRGIYVYRDGRDVALALWRTKAYLHPDWRDLSFSEFLRRPLDWQWSPGHRAKKKRPVQTIAEHWYNHLEHWNGRLGIFIRYEILVTNPKATIARIAWLSGLPQPNIYKPVLDLVGNWPDGAEVGAWKRHFSTEDLDFFHQHVPEDFWGLW